MSDFQKFLPHVYANMAKNPYLCHSFKKYRSVWLLSRNRNLVNSSTWGNKTNAHVMRGRYLLCAWAYQSLDYDKLMSHAFRI